MAVSGQILTEGQTADGDSTNTIKLEGATTIYLFGGFGGGTVTLLISVDGGVTFETLKDKSGSVYSYTAGQQVVVNPGLTGALLKVNLNGATAATFSATAISAPTMIRPL